MIDMNCLKSRPPRTLRLAVTLVAGALLLCALPAGAGLSGGVGTAGAGHSLKETLAETTDLFGEMVSAFIEGDDETVSELMGEVAKTPGKLVKRAFPVLEAPQAIANRLKSAKQKIKRFVSGTGERLTDARAALATDGGDKNGGWSDASLLEGDPLPTPTKTTFAASNLEPRPMSPATLTGKTGQEPGAAGAKPADSSWDFEQWVMAKQDAHPHCYGVVDPETLPPECFGDAGAASPAAGKVADSPRTGAADWVAGKWTEDDGWSGWDNSDDRYSEADRDAARVGVFAADCWGVYEVTTRHGLYELMRARMQRNECPNEETDQASYDDATVPGDYLSALNDLEAQEAARLRLEEEERERQARLEEEEERERLARREERRRLDERERQRQREYDLAEQRQQAEYRRQALQNTAESLRGLADQVNRTYGGGGTTGTTSGGGYDTCEFRYCHNGRGEDCGRPTKCTRPDGTTYWKRAE